MKLHELLFLSGSSNLSVWLLSTLKVNCGCQSDTWFDYVDVCPDSSFLENESLPVQCVTHEHLQ